MKHCHHHSLRQHNASITSTKLALVCKPMLKQTWLCIGSAICSGTSLSSDATGSQDIERLMLQCGIEASPWRGGTLKQQIYSP